MYSILFTAWITGFLAQENPAGAGTPAQPPIDKPVEATKSTENNPAAAGSTFLRQFDRNGDGVLSVDELPNKFTKKFAKMDTNRDGVIDAAELLGGSTSASRQARRLDNLRLDSAGRVTTRSNEPSPVLEVARMGLRRADFNQDGFVDWNELRFAFNNLGQLLGPGIPVGGLGSEEPAPAPTEPAPPAAPPIPNSAPNASANPPPAASPAKPSTSGGIPSAADIIENLDANGNGKLDRNEAVDKLVDNFDLMDRNRDGVVDRAELERSLKLAKLLGIKPSVDPRSFVKKSKPAPAEPKTPETEKAPTLLPRPVIAGPKRGAL